MAGGSAGNLVVKGQRRGLFIADCNPSSPYHWYYQRYHPESEGGVPEGTEWYSFLHTEQPLLFDWETQSYTVQGERTKSDLLRAYPAGYTRDRMVYGKWVAAEGQVYSMFDSSIHVIPMKASDFPGAVWRLSFDWGGTSPTAVGLFAEWEGKHYLFKEIYRSRETVSSIISRVKMFLALFGVEIRESVVDHNTEHFLQLQEAGLNPVLADKEVLAGIEVVRNALIEERVFINQDSLEERDLEFVNAPQGVAEEMLSYSHKPQGQWVGSYRDEIPVKENDHSLDMFRYYLKHLEMAENYMPGLSSISTVEDKRRGVWL